MNIKFLIVLFVGSLLSLGAAAKDKYIFSTYTQKPVSSVVKERVLEACSAVGLKCEVQEMPGKRALSAANAGEVDGDATRLANLKELSPEDTGNLSQVKEPILEEDIVLVTKDSTKISDVTWAEINKLKSIAFLRGAKLLEKNIQTSKQAPNQDIEPMFQMLLIDRVDGVLTMRTAAAQLIKDKGYKGLTIHSKAIAKNVYFNWVNNSNKDIIPKLEEGIKKIKANGKYDAIEKKYLGASK